MRTPRGWWVTLLILLVIVSGSTAWAGNTVGGVAQNAAVANGNGTVITTFGTFIVATYVVSGTFSATVNFEGSGQDGSFQSLGCVPVTGGSVVSSATAAGVWRCNIAGMIQIRARVSGYVSGSVTVSLQANDSGSVLVGPATDSRSSSILTSPTLNGTVFGTPTWDATQTFPSVKVGASSPTSITNIRVYSSLLTPSQMAASIAFAEQTFTVTGLTTADKVVVNPGGAQGTQCAFAGTARVSGADTLALTFFNSAASLCTPASSTYLVVAIRS